MLSFQPDTAIEKQLKNLQGLLVEAYAELRGASLDEKAFLNRFALISNVGASTRIENAVLTDAEIEWVDTALSKDGKTTAFDEKKVQILDKLSKDRERSVEEVVGSRQVLTTIYQQANNFQPLSESVIRGLHQDLLRYYPPAEHYAGQYKTVSNRVVSTNHKTREERIVLEPAEPGVMTETAMHDLVAWYNLAIKEHHWPLLVAIEFMFRFLAIHPFQDGNGRLGRALFILVLLQSGDEYLEAVAPYIAIDRHIEQNKAQYYRVLQQCSEGKFRMDPGLYNYGPLANFFLHVFKAAIADIDIYRKKYADLQGLSETASRLLACFKSSPEKRLKVSELEDMTSLPRRTIQYALKTLTEQSFLQKLGKGAGSRYQLVF